MKIKITARTEEEMLRADKAIAAQLDIIERETVFKRPVVEGWLAPPKLEYSFEFPVVVIHHGGMSMWRGYGYEDITHLATAYKAVVQALGAFGEL